jgi:hypothetical protein
VNVLEEPIAGDEGKCEMKAEGKGCEIALDMRCFEIRTLRLVVG